MPDPQSLYQELQHALDDFKNFLNEHADDIQPVIGPLNQLLNNRVFELIDQLVELLTRLRAEIANLNINNLGPLDQVTEFTASIKTLLETSKSLLPNEAGTINDILAAVDVVGGLPTINTVKDDILSAIDVIIERLNFLKS
ncbi:MAG TPA: hypothetical protein VF708_09315 [Pyrinomonadaceae bacterium]|jgi:uncharacterized protein YydD (DUF2326 family)